MELFSAIGNLLLRNSKNKSVATRVPFEFDKELKVDKSEALDKALQHAFEEKLKPGIENKYDISKGDSQKKL